MKNNWKTLSESSQLDEIKARSFEIPCVIFKHSTRCSISNVALQRMNSTPLPYEKADFYLLDLLNYRAISNSIAEQFAVHHESPQVLLINKGECCYSETHLAIDPAELQEEIFRCKL